MDLQKEALEQEILRILEGASNQGFTISDLVRSGSFSRSAVRIILAKLEGKGLVDFRNIGMAKLYFFKDTEHE